MIDFAFLTDTFLKLSAALPVTLGLFISAFLRAESRLGRALQSRTAAQH